MKILRPDLDDRLSGNVWRRGKTPAAVAVSNDLWQSIRDDKKPLPLDPNDGYRLRIVARKSPAGGIRYFLGFYTEVIASSGGIPVVRFYSWTNRLLGTEVVDFASGAFDLPGAGHTMIDPENGINQGALFVALDRFSMFSFLSGPKVPWTGGTGVGRLTEVGARERPSLGAASDAPCVIAGGDTDDWLAAVRKRLETEVPVLDEAKAMAVLAEWKTSSRQSDAIELVSHSNDDNILAIGAWRLRRGAFQNVPRDVRAWLKHKTIRVVGCSTAIGSVANDVLRYLEEEFEVFAYGAVGVVGIPDLVPTGTNQALRGEIFMRPHEPSEGDLTRENYITESALRRGGDARPFSNADRDLVFGSLAAGFRNRFDELEALLLNRPYFTYPGLLRLPSAYTQLPARPDARRRVRVDSLFHGRLIRIVATETSGRSEYLFLLTDVERAQLQVMFGWQ